MNFLQSYSFSLAMKRVEASGQGLRGELEESVEVVSALAREQGRLEAVSYLLFRIIFGIIILFFQFLWNLVYRRFLAGVSYAIYRGKGSEKEKVQGTINGQFSPDKFIQFHKYCRPISPTNPIQYPLSSIVSLMLPTLYPFIPTPPLININLPIIQQFLLINYTNKMKIRASALAKNPNTPRVGANGSPRRAPFKKQQSFSVNNIRESSYKITRSKSNRTEHSLQTKQPIRYNKEPSNSSNKYPQQKEKTSISKNPPNTPSHIPPSLQQKNYQTAETVIRKHQHTFTTPQDENSHAKDTLNQSYANKWTTHSNNNQQTNIPQCSEIQCLKIIWHNVKIIKANGLFKVQVLELEKNIERILLKIAEDQNCLSDQCRSSQRDRKNIKTTNQSDNINIYSARIEQLFNNKSEDRAIHDSLIEQKKMIYMIDEQMVQSYKGSYDSVRIENEDSHKYQFLNMYEQSSGRSHLRDITNSYLVSAQSSDRNCTLNNKESSVRLSQKSEGQREDRLYLKNIVKKVKKSRIEGQGENEQPSQKPMQGSEACCDKITKEHEKIGNMDILTYSCSFLDCDFSKKEAPSSSGSSESKREVLNQIISMLNQKYQKSTKIEFNKVFI